MTKEDLKAARGIMDAAQSVEREIELMLETTCAGSMMSSMVSNIPQAVFDHFKAAAITALRQRLVWLEEEFDKL